jgi:hypothetical protein
MKQRTTHNALAREAWYYASAAQRRTMKRLAKEGWEPDGWNMAGLKVSMVRVVPGTAESGTVADDGSFTRN